MTKNEKIEAELQKTLTLIVWLSIAQAYNERDHTQHKTN